MPVPNFRNTSAKAEAFLRHPANVGTWPVVRESVEPLGEGKTREVPAGMSKREEGANEYPQARFLGWS